MKIKKYFKEEEVMEIFVNLLEALAFFQEEFIYHSNITMKNIVIDDEGGNFRLAD